MLRHHRSANAYKKLTSGAPDGYSFDGDAALTLDFELVEDLSISLTIRTGDRDGPRELKESIAESALAMIDICELLSAGIAPDGAECTDVQ